MPWGGGKISSIDYTLACLDFGVLLSKAASPPLLSGYLASFGLLLSSNVAKIAFSGSQELGLPVVDLRSVGERSIKIRGTANFSTSVCEFILH